MSVVVFLGEVSDQPRTIGFGDGDDEMKASAIGIGVGLLECSTNPIAWVSGELWGNY